MPPNTRSQVPATASRTYHSSPPLHQARFPAQRKVVKTYGRRACSARSLRQQTLTQIYDINRVDLDNPVAIPVQDERPKKRQKRQKRRKTMGDAPTSSFHTQTLTQLCSDKGEDSDKSDENDESDEIDENDESDADPLLMWDADGDDGRKEEAGEQDGPDELLRTPTKDRHPSKRRRLLYEESGATSVTPQTPSNRKIKVSLDEVPSSQPSPFTPMLDRSAPHQYRSPLTERSININAPPPTLQGTLKRPRNLVIQDSYGTVSSSLPSDPTSSPSQDTRREPLAEIPVASLELGEVPGSLSAAPTTPRTNNPQHVSIEIPDSDDEPGSLGPSPQKAYSLSPIEGSTNESSEELGTPTPGPRRATLPSELGSEPSQPEHVVEPAGVVALAEEYSVLGSLDEPEDAFESEDIPETDVEATDSEEASEPGTPTPKPRRVQIDLPSGSDGEVLKETPIRRVQKSQGAARHTQARSQFFYSQGLESQRVPLEVIRSLGPQTDRSDIAISIHPDIVLEIVNGTRDHEFRNYKFPICVSRVWIYITHPTCELKYMATIGPAREPGEIESDSGIGNSEFNAGTSGFKFAHELLQVFQLNNPLSLQRLKDEGWVKGAPTRYEYLPPTAVGSLLSNLRCALFDDGHGEEYDGDIGDDDDDADDADDGSETRAAGVTVSQELEQQIRSEIIHQTQIASPDTEDAVIIPSSQDQAVLAPAGVSTSSASTKSLARPVLPTDNTDTSSATSQRQNRSQSHRMLAKTSAPAITRAAGIGKGNIVPLSQATTASEPSTPEKSRDSVGTRPVSSSSGPSLPEYGAEEAKSPIRRPDARLLLNSSEAALLPDSLLVDDVVRRPPPVIWDSDEDLG